ncbi:MAG: serine/threonine protein kinase, partial [Pseudomonadota bacterium]
FRMMAREDLRHLLKQKRAYAPNLLTPSQHRMLAKKSVPAEIWMATGKRAYNFITRRMMNWSDGEGTEDRVERDGPALRSALMRDASVSDLAICSFARPAKGAGLYLFVETHLSEAALRKLCPVPRAELIQTVEALPRDEEGAVRLDMLQLVASNRVEELVEAQESAPELTDVLSPIIAARLNLTDRDRPG